MMSSGSTELPQHLQELENYMPREELLTLFPNVTKEQVDIFLSLVRNESRVNTAPADHAFCDVGFRDGYKMVHGYLAVMICMVGAFTNALNMIILTRREMINSTNTILTGLAVADFLLLTEYTVYATSYIKGQDTMFDSYVHSVFILFHAHYTQITHTIAICLTITLAVWRYIAICKPHLSLFLCTLPRARIAVLVSYLVSPILSVPNYMAYSIHQYPDERTNSSLYHVNFSEWAKSYNGLLRRVNFWFHSVLIKLIPCLLLSCLIYFIIRAMYTAKRRKENLIKMGTPSMETEKKIPRMEKLTEKTTRMLLVVLLLFLATELPQGILSFLSGIYGPSFFTKCYLHWGEMMDLLALINSAVNFLLYYIMSHQFRVTFRCLLYPPPPVNLSPRMPGETVSTQL